MHEYEKLISIAAAEVGYIEKASNSQLDDKTANAGNKNYTKYARDLDAIPGFYNGRKNGYPWCDVFVDWCFVQAFGVDRAKELLNHGTCGAGVYFSAQYFKNKGRFYTSEVQIGDQIFFNSSNDTFVHTGLVYKVDSSTVYTIEGNTNVSAGVVENGGSVCKKSYPKGYKYIAGYGRPKYTEIIDLKSLDEIVKEVLSGKWGNGSNRVKRLMEAGYDANAVQKKINEMYSAKPTVSKPVVKEEFEVKEWKNGSTPEPVYADSACRNKIGTIFAWSKCPCYGMVDGKYIVSYDVSGTNYHKVGFVKYPGGIK